MKVKELIEILESMDENKEIEIWDSETCLWRDLQKNDIEEYSKGIAISTS